MNAILGKLHMFVKFYDIFQRTKENKEVTDLTILIPLDYNSLVAYMNME